MTHKSVANIMRWIGLFRDIGLILGVPTLMIIGIKLYERQIDILKTQNESLKTQNEFLKETQYDRAYSLIDSQKKIFQIEREILEKKIYDLKYTRDQKDEKIRQANKQLGNTMSSGESDRLIQQLADLKASMAKDRLKTEILTSRLEVNELVTKISHETFSFTGDQGPEK
jgi:hypothetical protein